MRKSKIINDPLYGFISIQSPLAFEIIQHPYFQRLRHIRQLGLSDLVFPGAVHSRFQHALGAYHLMGKALEILKNKGIRISNEEIEASQLAILLHDIGHGPLSHALEETLLPGIKHESITYLFLLSLNEHFRGALDLTLKIFRDGYNRHFFHQLINSQLDIDRMDYLQRDSFFTGVQEGTIGVNRILEMLNVFKDSLVVEDKAVYSIENFITSRRLMYWQVYLHKTALSAEQMLVNVIRRAQWLAHAGHTPECTPALQPFLENNVSLDDLKQGFSPQKITLAHPMPDPSFRNTNFLEHYSQLDDHDIWAALKIWSNHNDKVLSLLSQMLLARNIFQIRLEEKNIKKDDIRLIKTKIMKKFNLTNRDAGYLFSCGVVTNEAYVGGEKRINILLKTGEIADLAAISDLPQISALSKIVKKNFLCWPKNVILPN